MCNTQAIKFKDKLIGELLQSGHLRVYKNGCIKNRKGQKINGWVDQDGYIRLTLRWNLRKFSVRKHRIIWIAINGPIQDPTLVVNHKNGKKHCNNPNNLELVTKSENLTHAWNTGLRG